MSENAWRLAGAAAAVWIVFAAAVYLPDVGRGFVKDDFRWVTNGRDAVAAPASAFRLESPDFYRPLVVSTFAVDYFLYQHNARAYGFTNLTLYAACALTIVVLLVKLGLGPAAAAMGTFAWAVNPHGINMAVVWLSGRTSLLLTLTSVAAALAFLSGRRATGAIFVAAALLSKEEAVALPMMIAALLYGCGRFESRTILLDFLVMLVPLAIYLVVRNRTPAITPWSAPSYYRLTLDWHVLAANVLSYLDRATTVFVALIVIVIAVVRTRFWLEPGESRLIAAAVAWSIVGFAITVFVPSRSSLYAVFPSVGMAIAGGVVLHAIQRTATPGRFNAGVILALVMTLLCLPVYRSRNARYVEPARVSTRAMTALLADLHPLPDRGAIEFRDEPRPVSNFRDAFGTMAGTAVRLYTGRNVDAYVRTPTGETLAPSAVAEPVVAVFQLIGGRVERVY